MVLPKPPAVSILKPLCGVEPLTELALESFFLIDYPDYQLIFGELFSMFMPGVVMSAAKF